MDFQVVGQGIFPDEKFLLRFRSLLEDDDVIECKALIAFVTLNGLLKIGLNEGETAHSFVNRSDTRFQWIVGADLITTSNALKALQDLASCDIARHQIRAFLSKRGHLFHPKVYIFKKADGTGSVFVGSNNLTPAGLETNIEVSVFLNELSSDELQSWENLWSRVYAMSNNLFEIDDELLERVRQARIRDRPRRRVQVIPAVVTPIIPSVKTILIRQVPRAGSRTSQVHFTKYDVETYFEFTIGSRNVAKFYHFEFGILSDVEDRPLVYSGANMNPKIELSGAKRIGENYPSNDLRPLIIFERIATEEYRYISLLPGDDGYNEVNVHMSSIVQSGRTLKSDIMDLDDLLDIWPDYPT